jgi:tripartite-type tricarboxylate transporter receptor subunit TctC
MLRAILGAAFAAALTVGPAIAQDFPTRPVNILVPAPAGGPLDFGARVLASIAEKALGQPVVVNNKVGAAGQVAWTELARSKPDGYTIGYIIMPGTNTVIIDPERQAIFNENSFVHIANQVLDPGVIWVRADSPYKSLKELLEAAKASPGAIRAATTGILSDDHLAILIAEEASPGSKFRIVHLEGAVGQLKEVMGGNVEVAFDNVASVTKPVKAGQARALAVMDKERSKYMPDIPTTGELGYPNVISASTRGIVGPKGIPEPIVKKLSEVLKKAMEDPEHIQKLEAQGLAMKPMIGPEFAAYWKDQHERAKKYTEWAKQRPQ